MMPVLQFLKNTGIDRLVCPYFAETELLFMADFAATDGVARWFFA